MFENCFLPALNPQKAPKYGPRSSKTHGNLAQASASILVRSGFAITSADTETGSMRSLTQKLSSMLIPSALLLTWLVASAPNVSGQDVVVEKKPDGTTVKRQGEIVDWIGVSLKLDQSGRMREIDNDQIESIETRWPPEYTQALSQIENGELAQAASALGEALEQERRLWAQNVILAKLIGVQQTLEQHVSAAQTFFRLVGNDPQSRFLHLAPLPWETGKSGGNLPSAAQAQQWLESGGHAGSDLAAVSLVAASWLMTSRPEDARPVLEELANDLDPTISALAVGQLWRQQQAVVNAKRLTVWRRRLAIMPQAASAGPLYTIASATSQASMNDLALRDFMRIVILHPDQGIIAAPALYRAANLLHNEGRTQVAASLVEELKTKYPQSPWAREANFGN